jgi:DNA-binding beta-propeller fold protein YncE
MTDLDDRFRRLERMTGPDLWPDIEGRVPRSMPDPGPGRKIVVAAVAMLLAAGGAAVAIRAFVGWEAAPPARPAATPAPPVDPVVDVTLPIKWPVSLVYGEGSIWVAESANDGTGTGTVYRIDPDTAEILAEIQVPSVPGWEFGGGGMEAAGGSLWIAGYYDKGSQGAIVRIDTTTNEVAHVLPLGGEFAGDVGVDERGIWVTLFSESSVELARLDPQTLTLDLRTSLGVDWAREVVSVDGHIWIEAMRSRLLRIDPETAAVVQEVRVPGAWSLTTADGVIWATSWTEGEGNSLARIDPATGAIQVFPSGPLDGLVEAGPSGVWGRGRGLAEGSRGVGIVRFDPTRGMIDASLELTERKNPIDLAVAAGSVWVAYYEEGVTRVELRPA